MVGRKPAHHHWDTSHWSRQHKEAEQQEFTKKSVWVHGLFNPSPAREDSISRGFPQPHDRHPPDKDQASALVLLLRACAKNKDLCRGAHVHDEIVRRGLLSMCSDALVIMYAKCGALSKAKDLFIAHRSRNVFTWTALISGFAQMGQGQNALDYFDLMQGEGLSPDAVTFTCALKACGTIGAADKGKQIHDEIKKQGLLGTHVKLGNSLINMYAKCGALLRAQQVLEELPARNTVSWNALIAGYADQGKGEQALGCFKAMRHEGLRPDGVTFICLLKACGSIGAAAKGKELHDEIDKLGLLESDLVLGNALVDMYVKCDDLKRAREVSDGLPIRDVVTWNALIAGYAQHGEGQQALYCYEQMQGEGLSPNEVTYICILKACGSVKALNKGEQIHDQIANQGLLQSNLVLGTALVDMYAKCGALGKAQSVLEKLPTRNVISWSALISGYAQNGCGQQALDCFGKMQREGILPDEVTYVSLLKACAMIGAIDKGKQIHDEISAQGWLKHHTVLGNALVDMYAKCGALAKARQVLEDLPVRNVIAWSALIAGYAEHGQGRQAVSCFEGMVREGLSPDSVTFISVLKACGSIGATDKGEFIHDQIAKQGLLEKDIVLGTALVDMYVKCGALTKARRVFEELCTRDAISWSALITGYAEHGECEQVLKCFEQMQREGLSPDSVTFIGILRACGTMGAADMGDRVHDEIAKQGLLGSDVVLGTALVDMYAKCGALTKARQVFEQLPIRNVVAWSVLIAGYVQQGDSEQALDCFKQMQQEGPSPDAATFLSVLSACSRLGLVEDAQTLLESMSSKYSMKPNPDHYSCLVDLFGRIGQLDKAKGVIEKMPSFKSGAWSAILSACQKCGDVNAGQWAFNTSLTSGEV